MAFSAFIDDAYTETGFIPEVDRLYPSITFDFRPMTVAEWMQYVHEADVLKLNEVQANQSKLIASHLVKWNLRDRSGNIVPINPQTMQKLKPQLSSKLFKIVSGQEPSESVPVDPEASDAKN